MSKNINTDYFTPPKESMTKPINIPQYNRVYTNNNKPNNSIPNNSNNTIRKTTKITIKTSIKVLSLQIIGMNGLN
jgi:hypothetical protein